MERLTVIILLVSACDSPWVDSDQLAGNARGPVGYGETVFDGSSCELWNYAAGGTISYGIGFPPPWPARVMRDGTNPGYRAFLQAGFETCLVDSERGTFWCEGRLDQPFLPPLQVTISHGYWRHHRAYMAPTGDYTDAGEPIYAEFEVSCENGSIRGRELTHRCEPTVVSYDVICDLVQMERPL